MAKSKTMKLDAGNAVKDKLSKTKEGRVTKSTEPEPVKAKKTVDVSMKQARAGKTEKLSKKGKAFVPPPVESEEESDSDASDENDSDESASSSESDATSESEGESKAGTVSKTAMSAKLKTNGAAPKANGVKSSAPEASGDEDSGGSESESESESESDEQATASTNGAKLKGAMNPSERLDDSEDDSADDSDKASDVPVTNGNHASSDSDDSDDDDNASSASDDSDDENVANGSKKSAANKRKADTMEEPSLKKQKIAESAKSQSLFVGGISWNVDEDWLKREFESFGTVTGARIITHKDTGKSKGFGYVDFASEDDAQKALKDMNGAEIDGRAIKVDLSESRPQRDGQSNGFDRSNNRAQQFGDVPSPESDTLWLGNLSFDVTAESLRENFEEYGSITRISLPTHPEDGQLKGFGYVGYSSIEEAKAAFDAWKGQTLMGRPVRVDFSTPKPDNGFGGGRGRGSGDRGGFRGRGGDRGGFRGRGGDRGRGGFRGRGGDRGGFRGRGGSTNRGGVGDFSGKKMTF